jgi:hypothetical protein
MAVQTCWLMYTGPADSLVGAMNPCAAALLERCILQAGALFDMPM